MLSVICILGLAVVEFLVVRFMLRNNPGSHVRKHIGITLVFSLLAMVVAVVLELYGGSLFEGDVNILGSLATLPLLQFIAYMGVGAIEEFAKFFPFSRYLLSKGYMTSVTDTVTYFAIIGLVFGIVEDVLYTLQGPGGTAFLRLAVGLFFHAALTSIVGFYFARSYFLRSQQRQTLVAYLSVAAIHGIYDYSAAINDGLFIVAWAMAVFVNCYMFWLYYKAVLFDFQFRSGMLRMSGMPGAAYAPAPAPSYIYAGVNQYQQPTPWQPPQPPAPQLPVQPIASYQPPQSVQWQQPGAPPQPLQQYRPPVSPFTPQ